MNEGDLEIHLHLTDSIGRAVPRRLGIPTSSQSGFRPKDPPPLGEGHVRYPCLASDRPRPVCSRNFGLSDRGELLCTLDRPGEGLVFV